MRDQFGRACGYAAICLVLIYGLRLGTPFVSFPKTIDKTHAQVSALPDFTAKLINGELSVTGLDQPYIWETKLDDGIAKLVVDTVSTSTPPVDSLAVNKNTDNVFLVTRTAVSVYNPMEKSTEIRTFGGSPDTTITKNDVVTMVNKLVAHKTGLSFILWAIFVGILTLGKMIGVLFPAALLYIVVRIRKFNWSYKQILTVSLYAITLPMLIATIAFWWADPLVGSLGTLLFFIIMYATVSGFDGVGQKT
jgi:hypothetical protein